MLTDGSSNKMDNHERIEEIKSILPQDAYLESFRYEPTHFGNMKIVVAQGTKIYTFIADKGQIFLNDIICDNNEENDIFSKMIKIIKESI